MSHELEALVQIGQVVTAKYRIDRILGAGGMGIVVAATDLQLDQLVALKFIRPEAMTNPEVVSRFEREARAAVRLRSEHVARIIDVGRLETGSPYIVMEYLEGQDLAALLQQHGPLDVSSACDFIVQACDAIVEAHELGIVHRDLKPGNLFLARTSHGRQAIKVLDFGISKSQLPGADASMTRTQAIMGSPGYMSPEQMRSARNVDARTDVWSLGVILYELVTGRAPFQADTFSALCVKVATEPVPALPALPATVPPGFEAVLRRALEKDPGRRHASANELAGALSQFGTSQTRERAQRLASPPGVHASASHHIAVAAIQAPSTLGGAAGEAGPAQRDRSRARALAGLGLGVIAAALAVAIGVTRDGGGRDAARALSTSTPPVAPRGAASLVPPPVALAPLAPPPVVAPPSSSAAAPPDGAAAGSARPDLRRRPVTRDAKSRNDDRPPRPAIDPFSSPD